jgi:uncharacterized protein (DUF169 family)
MQSKIAEELRLRYLPIATIFTEEKPDHALQFGEGARGCVVTMLTAAAKGQTAVFDRQTTGCPGGLAGLCFGGAGYDTFRGGFEYFLSAGRGQGYPEGEGYKKTPELAREAIAGLRLDDLPQTYRVFRPLNQVDPDRETPALVTFYANPDQLSALVVLANYGRPRNDNVVIPFAAGCQTMCLLPYQESLSETPRAVVGIVDISARPRLPADMLAFTVPWRMFHEMEDNIPGSFLERKAWLQLRNRLPSNEPV